MKKRGTTLSSEKRPGPAMAIATAPSRYSAGSSKESLLDTFEYTATDIALELYDSLVTLTTWAERHRGTIAAARERYDRERGREHERVAV